MRINNPMLGMTDFSMIPSYFIDDASLLHGTCLLYTSLGAQDSYEPICRHCFNKLMNGEKA